MKKKAKSQQGAVLIVSLVMLTILTLLGVSNMSSSTLDLKMAANSQTSYDSFQASYSAIGRALNDSTISYDLIPGAVAQTREYSYGNSTVSVTVTATALGRSLGDSVGQESLQIEIRSVANNGISQSIQVQGINKSQPKLLDN